MRNKFMRKGVSSIIGAIIAIAIVLSILTSLTLFGFGAFGAQQQSIDYARSIELARQMENLIITYNTTADGNTIVTITNNGSVRVDMKSLVYRDSNDADHILDLWLVALNATQVTDAGIYLRSLQGGGIYNATATNGYVYLSPGGLMKFEIKGSIKPISVITATGNVIRVPEVTNIIIGGGNYTPVAGSVIIYPINLGTIEDLTNRTDISVDPDELVPPTPGNLGKGMKSVGKHYVVYAEYTNAYVTTSSFFGYGNLVIGYNPAWTKNRVGAPKYNILITGPYRPYYTTGGWIRVNGTTYYPDADSPTGWRIKIIGFQPDTDNDIHVRYYSSSYGINVDAYGTDTLGLYYYANYYSSVVDNAYLYLKGRAEKVVIYYTVSGQEEYSYEPFFISADVDGNGNPEWVFMTEDTDFGDQNSLNDALTSSCYYSRYIYDDWSVRPFFVNLTGYTINGQTVAMVLVAFRMHFHDNLGGDVDEVDHSDRTLIGVYLIDAETGQIASSREYDYQELMNLEDTYPPNTNFFVETISLIVPDTNKTYFVAFAFQDPYSDYCVDSSVYKYHDDGDFTMRIEWLGMSFFARPPS